MKPVYHVRMAIQRWKYRELNLGKNSHVALGVVINLPKRMAIGDNTYINGGVFSIGEHSQIRIGSNCLISYNVHLRTMTHHYMKQDVLIREQGGYEKSIIVEDDVWIGYGAQILPGITLHRGCVVGAGEVVTRDVEPFCVVGGVPARPIKYRE